MHGTIPATILSLPYTRVPLIWLWHACRVSFDGVRDDTRRALATPISSVSPYADRTSRSPLVPATTFLFYSIRLAVNCG